MTTTVRKRSAARSGKRTDARKIKNLTEELSRDEHHL
jgi:hypothetical protein